MTVNNPFAGAGGFLEAIGYMIGVVPYLLKGMGVSIQLAAVGLLGGLILAIPLSVMKTYGAKPLRFIANLYIEFFRGTPLLLQMFIIYFGLPSLGDNGIVLDRMPAVWISLSLNSAAYQAEYFRGAFQTIDPNQITAARAMGMKFPSIVRWVLLPQLIRIALPAWSNEAVYIVKYASVAFNVAILDLMARAKLLVSYHFRPVEVFIIVALLYIVLLSIIAAIMGWIERKISIPGLLLDSQRDEMKRELG